MDLCSKRGTAKGAAHRVLTATGIVLLLLLTAVRANATNPGIDYPEKDYPEKDYLWPAQVKGGYITQSSSTQPSNNQSSPGATTKSTATISYKAFNGNSYQLVEHRGRYVNILVPESFPDGPFFTADHVEELVDRLDLLYQLYAELVQDQPGGSGLLTIAFPPDTCGMGCGQVGARGFEILSHQQNYEAIIQELDAGRLEPIFLHEMAHNFDTNSAYLHYLPDHAHAWTDMFEYFAPFRFSRASSNDEAPDDRYNTPVSSVWKGYVREESANWERCVLGGDCGDLGLPANSLWAMLYYRVEALHGAGAIQDSFKSLRKYINANPAPSSPQEKESIRILSLADGAQANISCYMDALKWPIEASTRARLERDYGSGNPLCTDADGDGFNAVNGDCDDNDANRNISVVEISNNGKDDDCDEFTDETSLSEAKSGDFNQPLQVKLPFEAEGSSNKPTDRDTFRFTPAASGRTRVTLCARGEFRGWVAALQADGSFLEAPIWNTYQPGPGCTSSTFDFGGLTSAGVEVIADEALGEYSLTVTSADKLLPDYSSIVQVSADPTGGMLLQIDDKDGSFASLGTDEIEIWISGKGVQLFEPFSTKRTIRLDSNTVPALKNGETYQVRIRPRANGLPLADFSAGHLFRYDRSAANLPQIDDRYSGAWFDTTHDGEGFIVEILKDQRALVFWFTYHPDGTQRWMLGIGEVKGNRIVIPELMDAHGGRFGNNFDPDDVVLKTVGSMSLSFLDCSTALVNYSVDNNGSHQSASRLTNIYGHRCGSTTTQADSRMTGSWYDPTHNGEGFVVEQIKADEALVFWFTYDDTGKQSWMFNTGSINNGTITLPQLRQPVGGRFGRSFEPTEVVHKTWGDLTLKLGCTSGTASYTTNSSGYSNGSQTLQQLTRLLNASGGCAE